MKPFHDYQSKKRYICTFGMNKSTSLTELSFFNILIISFEWKINDFLKNQSQIFKKIVYVYCLIKRGNFCNGLRHTPRTLPTQSTMAQQPARQSHYFALHPSEPGTA